MPITPKYFCDGPEGHFFCDDLGMARKLVNMIELYDGDWTITELPLKGVDELPIVEVGNTTAPEETTIESNGGLYNPVNYMFWSPDEGDRIRLDGCFSPEELNWMAEHINKTLNINGS